MITFVHSVDFAGAMSHDVQTNEYRGFTNGTCYVLDAQVTFTNFAVYAPGMVKEFTKRDIAHVTQELTQILDSFKALR